MKKIRLDLNDLEVTSFQTVPEGPTEKQGTVRAYECCPQCGCNPCCCPCGGGCSDQCGYTCCETCYPNDTCTPQCELETIRTCPI